MPGERKLENLIKNMDPFVNPGSYVFISLPLDGVIPSGNILGMFREEEGIAVIMEESLAALHGYFYESPWSWITLRIHSSLEAVGLTAAISGALARNNLPCNIVAAYYHDHIFARKEDIPLIMQVLKDLSESGITVQE